MNRTIINRIAALESDRSAGTSEVTLLRQSVADLMREEGMTEDQVAAEMYDLDNNPDRPRPFAHLTGAELDGRIADLERVGVGRLLP